MICADHIFRAYDIRGEAFIDFDEDGFAAIAQAFGTYVGKKFSIQAPKVFVSGDGRQSMPELLPAVIAGLEAAGCDIVQGGSLPTPLNYFAFHEGDFDAAIQISASHNPAQDNGLKLSDRKGAVCGEEIQAIKNMVQHQSYDFKAMGECAEGCHVVNFTPQYKQKLTDITLPQSALKIIVDAGNGISGCFYPEIFRHFGHTVSELFCDLDTTFPNHQPDPERPENLKDAIAYVAEKRADLAFVFDGDGDRMGVILEDGTALSADKIFYVLASDFLTRKPQTKIIVDSMISQTLIEKIKDLGGNVIVSPSGHSHIEQAMHTHKALLGGEQSGHFMFGENFYGHDDACLASLRFIAAVQANPDLLLEVTTQWPTLQEFSEKFPVADTDKFKILEKIKTKLLTQFPEANTLDGIRIDFGKGQWAIIRCSNTTPKIAVRIEAHTPEKLEDIKHLLVGTLESFL